MTKLKLDYASGDNRSHVEIGTRISNAKEGWCILSFKVHCQSYNISWSQSRWQYDTKRNEMVLRSKERDGKKRENASLI